MRPASTHGILAAVAVALALLAPLAGGGEGPGRPGVVELTAEFSDRAPFIDGVTLAEWIRSRRPLRVWDVRPDPSAFIRFAVPTASHVPMAALPGRPVDSTTIVLYDGGTGIAAEGWLLLRRLGHPDVRILERGVVGWIDGVLRPVLPVGTPGERVRYDRVADVSRYFGGLPRAGEPPARTGAAAEDAVQLLSRRGCY